MLEVSVAFALLRLGEEERSVTEMLPEGYVVYLTWGGDTTMARASLFNPMSKKVSEFPLRVHGGVLTIGHRELDSELLMTIERDAWRDYAEHTHRTGGGS